MLPPGLYEAVLTPKGEAVDNPDLVTGEWVMRCEARTLDDIRALGGNDLADERKFEAAARLSEINLALYRTFAQPAVRALAVAAGRRGDAPDAPAAPLLRDVRPEEPVDGLDRDRRPSASAAAGGPRAADNPLSPRRQALLSQQIVEGLDAWRKLAERLSEDAFHAIYGTPALQAALGIDTVLAAAARARPRRASCTRRWWSAASEELQAGMTDGGLAEALVRALLWVGMARNAVDERGFAAITRLRDAHPTQPADDARRLQGAGPRAVPDAHDRRGGGARAPFPA